MNWALNIVWVAFGGAVGACLRYCLDGFFRVFLKNTSIDLATLVCNTLGCFLLGFALVYFAELFKSHENIRLLVCVGFIASLTTFSTWIGHLDTLLNVENFPFLCLKICFHIVLAFVALFIGNKCAHALL